MSPQIQSLFKTAGVSAAEVDAAVETLRGSCDVSNRGLTFQFLTDYLALATDRSAHMRVGLWVKRVQFAHDSLCSG